MGSWAGLGKNVSPPPPPPGAKKFENSCLWEILRAGQTFHCVRDDAADAFRLGYYCQTLSRLCRIPLKFVLVTCLFGRGGKLSSENTNRLSVPTCVLRSFAYRLVCPGSNMASTPSHAFLFSHAWQLTAPCRRSWLMQSNFANASRCIRQHLRWIRNVHIDPSSCETLRGSKPFFKTRPNTVLCDFFSVPSVGMPWPCLPQTPASRPTFFCVKVTRLSFFYSVCVWVHQAGGTVFIRNYGFFFWFTSPIFFKCRNCFQMD